MGPIAALYVAPQSQGGRVLRRRTPTESAGGGDADPSMTLRVYAHAVASADEVLAQVLGSILDG